MIDLADERFGRLVALRACDRRKDGRMRRLCICDCGRELESAVSVSEAATRRAPVVHCALTPLERCAPSPVLMLVRAYSHAF